MISPLIERELRVQSRKNQNHLLRMGCALATFLVCGAIILSLGGKTVRGSQIFMAMGYLSFFYACFIGIRAGSSVLWEIREGTLGLLFLTHLNGRHIILGKLAAAMVPMLTGLLAAFPIMVMTLYLGGIGLGEWFRLGLVLMNASMFAVALGLWLSTLKTNINSVVALIGMGFYGSFWLTQSLFKSLPLLNSYPSLYFFAIGVTPLGSLQAGGTFWWNKGPEYFFLTILEGQAVTWALLWLAWRRLPRIWQDRPAGYQPAPRRVDVLDVLRKNLTPLTLPGKRKHSPASPKEEGAQHRIRQHEFMDIHPFTWLASQKGKRADPMYFVLGVLTFFFIVSCLIAVGTSHQLHFYKGFSSFFLAFLAMVVWGIKFSISAESSRQVAEEKHQGTLEWLLSTPMSEAEIARGQWLALQREYYRPLVLLMGLTFVFVLIVSIAFRQPLVFISGVTFITAALVDYYCLFWAGLWSGMRSRGVMTANSEGTMLIVGLPMILLSVLSFFYWNGFQARSFWGFWMIYVCISVLPLGWILFYCKKQVLTQMRRYAALHHQKKEQWWERLGLFRV